MPEIEEADIPDKFALSSSVTFHATLRNSTSRKVVRPVRVELIQDGIVKGWSPWVSANFEPEETIDFVITVDKWTWKEEKISHAGDYAICLSMRNSYGDIWIPMGQGQKVTIYDSVGVDAVRVDESSSDEIYDLHGRKVADDVNVLSPGIYIRQRNGTVTKIIRP